MHQSMSRAERCRLSLFSAFCFGIALKTLSSRSCPLSLFMLLLESCEQVREERLPSAAVPRFSGHHVGLNHYNPNGPQVCYCPNITQQHEIRVNCRPSTPKPPRCPVMARPVMYAPGSGMPCSDKSERHWLSSPIQRWHLRPDGFL